MTELARLASEAVDSEPITPADYGKAADEALQAGQTEAAQAVHRTSLFGRRHAGNASCGGYSPASNSLKK